MRANRKGETRPEKRLRSVLHRLGYRFRVGLLLRTGDLTVRPDIVFTRYRVAVFVDGCFWHSCPDHGTTPGVNRLYWGRKLAGNVSRDERVNKILVRQGWVVLRVWEHVPAEEAAVLVRKAVADGNSPCSNGRSAASVLSCQQDI
jgi:DNA mismatch endonuclease (patch repair protein)